MKTINKFAIAIFLALLVTTSYSQQRQSMSPEDRAEAETKWMTEELNLDNKTVKKVDKINLKYAKELQAKMQEVRQTGDRSLVREAMMELNKEKNKELEPVLGEEKYELYLKKMNERMEQRRQGRNGGGQGGGNR